MMNVHLKKENKVHELCTKLLQKMKPDIVLGDFTTLPEAGKYSIKTKGIIYILNIIT